MDGERVLLVGGAGFIGHHLAVCLRQMGADVMVADDMQINNIVRIVSDDSIDDTRRELYIEFLLDRFAVMREAGVAIRNVDARLMPDFMRVFNEFMPTKAVHLSAISSAVTANKVPSLAYDLQITTLRNLLELCQLKDSLCNHVAFMSSSTIYGDFEGDEVDETVRPQPRGVYANGKYMGERMMREASSLFGIDYTIIRPSALYGDRCVSGRVSQKFIENALFGKPLLLEGGGGGKLDFTHIDDLVEGIARGLALDGGRSRTFNITFGNARPISDLAKIIQEYIPDVVLEERPPAPEKPKRGTLRIDKAKEFLGFVPQKKLDVGYREYCEWYLKAWERVQRRLGE